MPILTRTCLPWAAAARSLPRSRHRPRSLQKLAAAGGRGAGFWFRLWKIQHSCVRVHAGLHRAPITERLLTDRCFYAFNDVVSGERRLMHVCAHRPTSGPLHWAPATRFSAPRCRSWPVRGSSQGAARRLRCSFPSPQQASGARGVRLVCGGLPRPCACASHLNRRHILRGVSVAQAALFVVYAAALRAC